MWAIISRRNDGDTARVIAMDAEVADRFTTRLRGLMFRRRFGPGDGLVLTPCGSIHTMMMRFPIDALFVARGGEVVDMAVELAPWRLFMPKARAVSVVELPARTLAACDVRIGDRIDICRKAYAPARAARVSGGGTEVGAMKTMRNERGASSVVAAVAFIALLAITALAFDYARGVMWRARVQKAVDAAALAGALELPYDPDGAYAAALQYCEKHGLSTAGAGVEFFGSPPTKIRVSLQRDEANMFAGVLGKAASKVATYAEAETGIVGAMNGLVPIGVEKRAFEYGVTYQLKRGIGACTGTDKHCSNFGPLALGGNGAQVYEDNLKNGYEGQVSANTWVSTETGNIVGPTGQAVKYRVSLAPGETYLNFGPESSRLIFVPVLESLNVNGKNEVYVDGFAAFFIEDYGKLGEINGKFIRYHTPGNINVPADNFDLWGVRLVK